MSAEEVVNAEIANRISHGLGMEGFQCWPIVVRPHNAIIKERRDGRAIFGSKSCLHASRARVGENHLVRDVAGAETTEKKL